jgi:hypothetical protein
MGEGRIWVSAKPLGLHLDQGVEDQGVGGEIDEYFKEQ